MLSMRLKFLNYLGVLVLTFHMKHDEDVNYNCKKCNGKISAHNRDWHKGMCDGCFNREYSQ